MYKQAIVVRKDVKIGKGKLASQVSHASLGAFMRTDNKVAENWNSQGAKKVVLKIEDEEGLIKLQKLAKNRKLPNFLVRDAGKTQIEPGTMTALGIGPAEDHEIDEIVGKLKLL